MKKILLSIVAASPLFLASQVLAQDPPEAQDEAGEVRGWGKRHGHPGKRGKWLKELGLNDEQMSQVRNIRKTTREKIQPLRKQVQEKRQSFQDTFASSEGADKLRALHAEIEKLTTEIHNLRFESLVQIRELLNEEQRKRFHDPMLNPRHGRHHKRFGADD